MYVHLFCWSRYCQDCRKSEWSEDTGPETLKMKKKTHVPTNNVTNHAFMPNPAKVQYSPSFHVRLWPATFPIASNQRTTVIKHSFLGNGNDLALSHEACLNVVGRTIRIYMGIRNTDHKSCFAQDLSSLSVFHDRYTPLSTCAQLLPLPSI